MILILANNIYEALKLALQISQEAKEELQNANNNQIVKATHTQSIIVLLTDGIATSGELNLDKIFLLANRWNRKCKAAIFTIAVGEKANTEFLKKLSQANSGFMVRIYQTTDTQLQLTDFYHRVSSPLLANITFMYDSNQVSVILDLGTDKGMRVYDFPSKFFIPYPIVGKNANFNPYNAKR